MMIYKKTNLGKRFSIEKQNPNKNISKKSNSLSFIDNEKYSKISKIFYSIYEDLFPMIISKEYKDSFVNEINKNSINILNNILCDSEIQIPFVKDIIEKIKEEIKNKIKEEQYYLEQSLFKLIKENNLIYITKFRKHCYKTEDLACHLCASGEIGNFLEIKSDIKNNENKNNNNSYIICNNCYFCYPSNCIQMYCKNCKKYYYSSILKDSENVNCLPATWDNYHCGTRKKELMKCLKCKEILYLDLISNRLVCKNEKCDFSSKPEHIIWGCHLCGKEFKSGAKIFNPLEFEILKKVINRALLYKIKAVPPFLPCCKGKIDEKIIFLHKRDCEGQLYKFNLYGKDIVVCQKCQALNKFNYFSWLCPLCSQTFILNNSYNKSKINKNNYSNSINLTIETKYNNEIIKNKKNPKNNINVINKSNSFVKTLDNSTTSIDNNNLFGFGFYLKKREANEYARNRAKIKSCDINLNDKNKSFTNIKDIKTNDESIDSNSKRRIRKRSTLKDILNARKSTPDFGKKKNNEDIDDLNIRTVFDSNIKKIDNIKNKRKINETKNIKIISSVEKTDNSNNISIQKNIYRKIKNDNSDIIDGLKMRNINKYININKKKKFASKSIDNNEKNQNFNYYNINNINNINIINSIEINKKEDDENKANNISKKYNIIPKKHRMHLSTSQNESDSSNNCSHLIRNSINKIALQKFLIDNNIDSKNKRKSEIKKTENNGKNFLNKTSEDILKKEISDLEINPLYDEINNNNKEHFKQIKVNCAFDRNSVIKSKEINRDNNIKVKDIDKFVNRFNWKRKRFNNYVYNRTSLENNKTEIKNENEIEEKKSDDLISIPIFDDKDYNYIKLIGKGSYGKIYLVEDKNTLTEYALKKVFCSDYEELLKFKKEFQLIYSLQNPNILRIYKIQIKNLDITTYCLYVLMERAQTDWSIEIKRRKLSRIFYKEKEIISILKQLTQGLLFLQKNKVAHRDIKPQNILIFPNNVYKIADMGEAKKVDKNRIQMATLRGSELFMSPLLYEGLKFNKNNIRHNPYKSDMFSLGLCFLYAICLNLKVLEYIREMKSMNSVKDIINKFLDKNKYSDKLIEIVYKMIDLDEEKRYDFEQLEEELTKI